MNWILSIFFLSFIFFFYKILGRKVVLIFDIENKKPINEMLAGFIIVFFIGFIIGLPCQFFHLSWNIFKYTYLVILLIILFYCVYNLQISINKNNIKYYLERFENIICNYFKENWFIYLLMIFFLMLALTNVLVYYFNNYDDAYYIGKIVNQVGANHLSAENFYNGALSNGNISISRLLNTFEISYGFFANVFHISIPFFCRVTMNLHNYFLVFSVYKAFSEYFIKKDISQFCLIPFAFLLISSGYAMEGNMPFSINMFDGWQFQSAMWYGGSIVRTLAIPVIIIFSEKLIYKFNLKNILFLCITYVTFMSFSTIFLIYAIIVTLVLFISKGVIILNIKETIDKNEQSVSKLCLLLSLILLMITKFLDKLPIIGTENYFSNLSSYIDFSNWYFYGDTFIYYGLAVFIVAYFIFKKTTSKFVSITMIIIFLMIYTKLFYELIIISSGFYWFVALRFTTSVQLILALFIGCLIVKVFEKLHFKKIILSFLSIFILIAVFGYIYQNIDEIKKQNWLASGMTEYGYSMNSIRKNDKMMPTVMCEVGEYFDQLDYGNYPLLLPKEINWDGYPLDTNGFVFASNRIELCTYNGADNLETEKLEILYKFFSNELGYNDIKGILFEHKIKYILVQDVSQRDELIKNNWTIVLSNDKINSTYYLLEYKK